MSLHFEVYCVALCYAMPGYIICLRCFSRNQEREEQTYYASGNRGEMIRLWRYWSNKPSTKRKQQYTNFSKLLLHESVTVCLQNLGEDTFAEEVVHGKMNSCLYQQIGERILTKTKELHCVRPIRTSTNKQIKAHIDKQTDDQTQSK